MSSESNLALDRLEAELFREARQELEPDQARVDRLWQSVAAASTFGAAFSSASASVPPASGTNWAAPTAIPSLPSPEPSPTVTTPASTTAGRASFGLRALASALVGGALLGFAAGYGFAGRSQDPPPVATPASTPVPAPHANAFSDASREAALAPKTDEPQPPTAVRKKPQAGRPSGIPKSSTEPAKSSFYEELQYLKRAQSALRQGNGALALGLMTELDSIQPGGALLSERGVTQVLAHCQLGDVASAERVAARLAAHGLASVYTERLENSCAGAVLRKP